MQSRVKKYKDPNYLVKWVLCVAWGVPLVAVGLLLCVTIVFSPAGVAVLALAALPMTRLEQGRLKRRRAFLDRDRPMPTENEVPWEM